MSFIHYNSISNLNEQTIERLKKCKKTSSSLFIVQHKYDGCNFQIIFSKQTTDTTTPPPPPPPSINIQYASRNRLLDSNEKFYNYMATVEKYKETIDNVAQYLSNSNLTTINLYGEMYGHVLKRIKYNNLDESTNNLIFFDVLFDNVKQCPKLFIEWANKLKIPIVETLLIDSFVECSKFDVENFVSDRCDMIEGIVIKSFDSDVVYSVKKKAIKFMETANVKQNKKSNDSTKKNNDPILEIFSQYLTVNRIQNVFGKQSWTVNEKPRFVENVLYDAFIEIEKKVRNDKKCRSKIYSIVQELNLFN